MEDFDNYDDLVISWGILLNNSDSEDPFMDQEQSGMNETGEFPFSSMNLDATSTSEAAIAGQRQQEESSLTSFSTAVVDPYKQNNTENLTKRKTRAPRKYVPQELKDEEYWRKRQKNTESARKCRAAKKIMKVDQTTDLTSRLDLLLQKKEDLKREYLNTHAESEKLKKALELNWEI